MPSLLTNIQILIALVISLSISLYSMPWWIRKLKERGYLAKDMYKRGRPNVVDKGGIAIMFVAAISFFLCIFLFRVLTRIFDAAGWDSSSSSSTFPTQMDYLIFLVISIYAIFGILDDYIEIRHRYKVIIPFFFALPLTTNMSIPFFETPWGSLDLHQTLLSIPGLGTFTLEHGAKYVVLPIYVMVAANLTNMHAGFNGLMAGLTAIMLSFIMIKALIFGNPGYLAATAATSIDPLQTPNNVFTAILLASVAGFLTFNFFPARIFEGNVGAAVMGSALGVAIVSNHFFLAGCFLFIPQFVNWMLYLYVLYKRKTEPKNKIFFHKFGKVKKNGHIWVPGPQTLAWAPAYFIKISEKQATLIQYCVTFIFGIIFILMPVEFS